MTALRIDTAKFKHICQMIRGDISCFNADDESIYSFYRWFMNDQRHKFARKVATNPADDLRSQLRVAAQAAQQFGASNAQIDFIVALAIKNNDFNVLSGGRLSNAEASRIIDQMKG